ncbi:Regulator of nonsense transcripts upf2 [Salvia divinorum]|uniref:Regulator of nonsense transcripts upf2 n=1 Tax=Salvia divinorum TaxID=28513 RepID=A0ABD1I4X5_SALDI
MEAVARLEEFKKSVEAKRVLRQSNLNPERPDTGFLRTLDSSIKRNTAVIKKLKQINEEQREGLMDEFRDVNLSKFVSEAVAAICDAKLKAADIQSAIQICSLLHQRYREFAPSLVQEDTGIFVNIIKDLTSPDHLKDRDATQTNLSLVASFARQGRFLLGFPLTEQDILEEIRKKIFRKAFQTYYDAAVELLLSEHTPLRQMEHDNAKILNAKGELSEDNATSYEKLRKSYDHLSRGVSSLAEALDVEPPVMPEHSHTTRVTSGEDVSSPVASKDSPTLEALWDDHDTKAFYECLPDLRAFVPAVLLGETESKLSEQFSKTQDQSADTAPESDKGQVVMQENPEVSTDSKTVQEDKEGNDNDKEEKDKEKDKDSNKEKGKEKNAGRGEIEKDKTKGLDGTNLEAMLHRLPSCVSRDLIDQLTVEFCYLNSKSTRKKLVRVLFNVPRTSLELLAYLILLTDELLEKEFNTLINKKDQMNIETKIRNIRLIGELCKFKIAPASLVFSCLKACLDDFTHHNIDVACNLLETCGRFLYQSPETTVRMSNMLEILMRLKNVKNLDPRQSTLVEIAYYLCKPPERSARVSKVCPPLHQYIRKLLFSNLDKSSIEHVLRQLRKLPWSECEEYLLKCFLKVHIGKYGEIHLIASLTASLSRYHDDFAVAIADEVLDEIRVGLELNEYGMEQQRIAYMRFLGEPYNYELVESSVIFDTLYLILSFGHGTTEQDTMDPPEDCFRIIMVIILLETCGHYFNRGSSKRKLDRFLIHFQRYILRKGVLPLDVEFDLQDLFVELRPKMIRYSSFEEVNAALSDLEELERRVSEKAQSEKYSDLEKPPRRMSSGTLSANGQSPCNVTEENGELHEDDVGETDSDSGSGTSDDEDTDQDEVGESEDEYDDGRDPASNEDDEVHVRQKASKIDPQEVADFDRELRALLLESLDSRN